MRDWERIQNIHASVAELLASLRRAPLDPELGERVAAFTAAYDAAYRDLETFFLDFREIGDHLYDALHIADGEGTVLYVNDAYTRVTGIRADQVLGRKVQDMEAEGVLYKGSITAQVLAARKPISAVATIHVTHKDVLLSGSPVFDKAGNIKLVVVNNRDVNELQKLKEQVSRLTEQSEKANEELSYLRQQQTRSRTIRYRSPAMESALTLTRTVAATDVTVLITGESGTGKELIADELYNHSGRKGRPFIKVNCAAIPAELLESELFGYEGGAFTGARKAGKAGMFELANGGVLLLDEIGDMPLPLQTKLLRVLQEREVMRIGGGKYIPLDLRLIASTNKDLLAETQAGRFREDLYYRLNVVPINLKPLRERPEDLAYLAQEFCLDFCKKYNRSIQFQPQALDALYAHSWPGNVRELENFVERLIVVNTTGIISREMVRSALTPGIPPLEGEHGGVTLRDLVHTYERDLISSALKQYGSLRKTAHVLGVDHSTLVKKCQRYGLGQSGGEEPVNFVTDPVN